MPTINQCDKYNEEIKDYEDSARFSKFLFNSFFKEYGINGDVILCKVCSRPVFACIKECTQEGRIC